MERLCCSPIRRSMFPAQRSCSRWILPQSPDSPLSHRYFLVHSVMNQVQDNSCGMMAILHVLLNINDSTIVGPRISSRVWRRISEATPSPMPPTSWRLITTMRCITPSSSPTKPLLKKYVSSTPPNQANHYCAFVPYMKVLYQLGFLSLFRSYVDGMLSGPVVLGSTVSPRWWIESFDTEAQYRQVLISTLKERIQEIVT